MRAPKGGVLGEGGEVCPRHRNSQVLGSEPALCPRKVRRPSGGGGAVGEEVRGHQRGIQAGLAAFTLRGMEGVGGGGTHHLGRLCPHSQRVLGTGVRKGKGEVGAGGWAQGNGGVGHWLRAGGRPEVWVGGG